MAISQLSHLRDFVVELRGDREQQLDDAPQPHAPSCTRAAHRHPPVIRTNGVGGHFLTEATGEALNSIL
jgi:hypothetical protein